MEHFEIDKNILYSVIAKQAGTVQKAFLELVMNSIDAGASKIDIEFDGKRFSVLDDGKGFESEDEIRRFFKTFGTPHKEGDAVYGKFRMGRGQIMAFATNDWYTGPFSMKVDIKNKGMGYLFDSNNKDIIKGCMINGSLYESLEPYEMKDFEKELKEYVKFSQIPVFLNKELISDNIKDVKWDKETEYGYIKVSPDARRLSVYNLGVKVTDYSAFNIGFGGILVSKVPFEVNFARNDILKQSCTVWKELIKI